jgi:hypothetical protein
MRRRVFYLTFCVLLSFQRELKAFTWPTLPVYHERKTPYYQAAAFWNYPGGAAALTFDNTASYLFNGSGSYISHGDVDPGANFSAFCWAKQTTATTNAAIMSKWSASTNERSWVLQAGADASKMTALIAGAGTTISKNYQSSVTALETTAWHQVGFVFAGSSDTLKLYVDGTESSVTKTTDNSAGGAAHTNTAAMAQGAVIKNGAGNVGSFFAGYITHCFTADISMTAAEVSATYNATDPADLNGHSRFGNMTHWYQNGNLTDTTATVFDRIGSANGTNVSITISADHP